MDPSKAELLLEGNVCFKKKVTIHSSDAVLWIVTVFLKQTLFFPTQCSSLGVFTNKKIGNKKD